MPIQATAAQLRGPIPTTPDPLVLTDAEWDTLAWALTEVHDLAHGAPADLRASLLAVHAGWIAPLIHTPTFCPDGSVIVTRPGEEHARGLARILRLIASGTRPSIHPTGMVFAIPAPDAQDLADRIEQVGR